MASRAGKEEQDTSTVQAPCSAIDAVLITVEGHQRVVGKGGYDSALELSGKGEQRTVLQANDKHDVAALEVEIDVLLQPPFYLLIKLY